MAEFRKVDVGVIVCCGPAAALDAAAAEHPRSVRVAGDELILVCTPGERAAVLAKATQRVSGLVLDVSDGWAAWQIEGAGARRLFARLSHLQLPAGTGVVQGAVASVPAKVFAEPDSVLILVASTLSHHIQERLTSNAAA